MPGPRSSTRALIIQISLTLLAFVLLGLAIYSNRGEIRRVLERRIDAGTFLVAFAFYLSAILLTFVRWYFLVRALDLPFRLSDATRLGFIGYVYNLVLPGGVGGDLVKAGFLCREHPENKTKAISSMVIDRVLGLLGLFILASIGGIRAWGTSDAQVRMIIVAAWGAVAAGLLGLTILFTPALYGAFGKLVRGRGRLETLFGELVATASAYRRRLGTVAAMLGMSVVSHCLFTIAFYFVSRALFGGEAPTLAQHLLVVPLTLSMTAIPIPFGALGLIEQISGQLFKLVGHPGGAVAMMGFRVLMFACGLLSAVVYATYARQARELKPAEGPA